MRRVEVLDINLSCYFSRKFCTSRLLALKDSTAVVNSDLLHCKPSAKLTYMQRHIPGLTVAFAAAGISWILAQLLAPLLPGISALLVAILLGVLWRNLAPVPWSLNPGLAVAAKPILRLGIVLLGFQLSLTEILGLGWPVILVICAAVVLTFGFTIGMGRLLKIPTKLALLIASGFSICGAAAVAGADSVLRPKKEHSATALGLVVLNGTLMIAVMPILFTLFSSDPATAGVWTGAAVHEVAQVVAVGQNLGEAGLNVAVTVKLGRVLLLALVLAALTLYMRTSQASAESTGTRRPPLVPLFVVGFAAAMLLRTVEVVPDGLLSATAVLQTVLLTAAMFALGMGVHLKSLVQVGGRPVVLSVLSTIIITVIGGVGAFWAIQ